MTKRANSILIDKFLLHVEDGLIVGRERSSGPTILEQMRDALQAIMDGEKPDDALGIIRTDGPGISPENVQLALAIHPHRQRGEKWAVTMELVQPTLRKQGREITERRARQVYNELRPKIEEREKLAAFFDRMKHPPE